MRQIKGSDLRAMRQFAGLTTHEMAKIAGVKTRKTYENWEKDLGFPDVNQFFLLISACGFDFEAFSNFLALKDGKKMAA